MVATREINIKGKAYTVRDRFSYQILDWATLHGSRLRKLSENDPDGEATARATMRFQKELTARMTCEPTKLTVEYLESEEATDLDYLLGRQLEKELLALLGEEDEPGEIDRTEDEYRKK